MLLAVIDLETDEMKTKKQIAQFLSGFQPETEDDENRIRNYFLYRAGKMSFGESPDLPSITYDQAIHWSNKDFPVPGTVIVWGSDRNISVVSKESWNNYTLAATLPSGGELSLEEKVMDTENWTPAIDSERQEIQREVSLAGLDWNSRSFSFEERQIPQNPKFVRLLVMGEEKGIGIFKEVSEDGKLHMHCYIFADEKIRYKDRAVLDSVHDYSFSDLVAAQRAAIYEALAEDNLVWNPKLKRLHPSTYRLKPGSKYYYLDTYWRVLSAIDEGKPKDNMRFVKANYFHSRAEAMNTRDFMVNLRNKQIIDEIDNQTE